MLIADTLLQSRYQVVHPIGEGGVGAVYLAKDCRLRCNVALKETFFSDVSMSKAFEREAELLADLRHHALPRVSDHFSEGSGQFPVMEQALEGVSPKKDEPSPVAGRRAQSTTQVLSSTASAR